MPGGRTAESVRARSAVPSMFRDVDAPSGLAHRLPAGGDLCTHHGTRSRSRSARGSAAIRGGDEQGPGRIGPEDVDALGKQIFVSTALETTTRRAEAISADSHYASIRHDEASCADVEAPRAAESQVAAGRPIGRDQRLARWSRPRRRLDTRTAIPALERGAAVRPRGETVAQKLARNVLGVL